MSGLRLCLRRRCSSCRTVSYTHLRSVNGSWKSPFSEEISVVPVTDKKPDAPDNLVIKGAYKTLELSWKNMDDTDSYNCLLYTSPYLHSQFPFLLECFDFLTW